MGWDLDGGASRDRLRSLHEALDYLPEEGQEADVVADLGLREAVLLLLREREEGRGVGGQPLLPKFLPRTQTTHKRQNPGKKERVKGIGRTSCLLWFTASSSSSCRAVNLGTTECHGRISLALAGEKRGQASGFQPLLRQGAASGRWSKRGFLIALIFRLKLCVWGYAGKRSG